MAIAWLCRAESAAGHCLKGEQSVQLMRVLIADDELLALRRLELMLVGLGSVELVGTAMTGRSAVDQARLLHPDLVVLDIRMPELDGLAAARELATLKPAPALIFLTAYDAHAVQAFELDAVDYLVKPVRRERLEAAINRVRARRLAASDEVSGERIARRTHLAVRYRGNLRLLPIVDVIVFRAEEKYVEAVTETETLLIDDSLRQIEDEFGDLFVRVHRQSLVARSRIVGLKRSPDGETYVQLRGLNLTPEVSRRNLAQLRQLLGA